jgi:hypothetical protein
MTRFFVIQCSSETNIVFVKEAWQDFSKDTVEYRHVAGSPALICATRGPEFYGKLDVLLVTARKIANAAPIIPEMPITLDDAPHVPKGAA